MKRAILLSIVFAFLSLTKSNAQQWSFVTSFGVTQNWAMPYDVVHAIEHDYWGYDIVHTRRIVQHGKLFYDVVLQRGDVFVTVSIGRYGRIFNRVVAYNYPFHNHVCNNFCGYHSTFYRRNVVACGGNHHHGHNHITYVRRNYYNHQGNGHGYAYGQYKSQGNKHYGNSANRKDFRDTNSYKSRQNSRDYQRRSAGSYAVRSDHDNQQSRSNTRAGSTRGSSNRSTASTRSGEERSSSRSTASTSSSESRSGRSYSSRSN